MRKTENISELLSVIKFLLTESKGDISGFDVARFFVLIKNAFQYLWIRAKILEGRFAIVRL